MSEAALEPPAIEPEVSVIPSSPLARLTKEVVDHCSTRRQELLEPILQKLFTRSQTPASTMLSRHGAFDGGLLFHIEAVARLTKGIAKGMVDSLVISVNHLTQAKQSSDRPFNAVQCLTPESILTVAILHDLNKIEDMEGNPLYVDNILAKGNRSDAKPWKTNEKCESILKTAANQTDSSAIDFFLNSPSFQYPSGLISLALAEEWSPGIITDLTDEEKQAITWHGGLYEKGSKEGFAGNECLLQIALHAADMTAARTGI